MTRNTGSIDRWIRALIGIALLALVFYGPKTNWGYLGLIPLATALFGYCPIYGMLGLSTRHHHRHSGTATT